MHIDGHRYRQIGKTYKNRYKEIQENQIVKMKDDDDDNDNNSNVNCIA